MSMTLHSSMSGGVLNHSALAALERELAFSLDEYRERLSKTRSAMAGAGVDVLLVSSPGNVLYLSGYQTFSVLAGETLVVPMDGNPVLIVPPPELSTALLHTWLEEAMGFSPDRDRGEDLASVLCDHGLTRSRVGVDKINAGLTPQCLAQIEAALPGARMVETSGLVEAVKSIKSPREIAHMRAAATMTDAGMAAAIAEIGVGRYDNDAAAAAAHAMVGLGSEYMCVSPIVTTGRRSGILHSTHKRVVIQPDDPLCIEIGACYQRYTTPLMRTAVIGKLQARPQRLADACLAALDAVVSALRPGASYHEVAEAGWEAIGRAGDDLVFHGTFGYGVGGSLPPSWGDGTGLLVRGCSDVIVPGMAFHHPVALRRLGEHGVMFSETTVVTETGCEVLGLTERKLFELPLTE
jgi:Xaa-Pro aminopeptidase